MKSHLVVCALLCLLLIPRSQAQERIPVSLKELSPGFGIRPLFLDDTVHILRYLDSLNGDYRTLTDSCVTINARLMAMENVLQYDYRHEGDTVWIDATHYIEDYASYSLKIKQLSELLLKQAQSYIEREHLRQDAIQQTALSNRKDTIERQHRTIINACEGIGVSDKARRKELKDLYYAYLSVFNRYDFSMKRGDSAYLAGLDNFSVFQKSILDNLLSNNNYSTRINNFTNTLKIRCGHNHTDVLRSYQRTFRQSVPTPAFSNLNEYQNYINSLQNIIDIQNSYLTVVDLREKINASGKRITGLYSSKFRDVSKTYQEVANTINIIPAYDNLYDADIFIANLNEFIQVQECYIRDFDRLKTIQEHGDLIVRNCSMKYSDVAKAYKHVSEVNSMAPKYKTLDDAERFKMEMDNFESIQSVFDTILIMLQDIDMLQDTILKGWMSHLTAYNAYQNIRRNFALKPSFIDLEGGRDFIGKLNDYIEMQKDCIKSIRLYDKYRQLDNAIQPSLQTYRNIRKAYSRLEKEYLNIKTINHLSELYQYIHQLEAFISVQEHILDKAKGSEAYVTDNKLKNLKDTKLIEAILGL